MSQDTYEADLAFLAGHTAVVELTGPDEARVAVAPAYQGRVMTSTLGGAGGLSFGWINRKFIELGLDDAKFNNYGGEDRIWLGPEAGQFGLWFVKGEPFDMDHWKTPAGLNSGSWEVLSRQIGSVVMAKRFQVTNYSGTAFQCDLKRTIGVLDRSRAAECLGPARPAGAAIVAFESDNMLANAGQANWTLQGGLLSIWTLGMFKPLRRGAVIVPFVAGEPDSSALGPKATTDYFGPLPPRRCRIGDDHLLFSCDGAYRSKIGVSPKRARDVLGSYDPDDRVLTIVQFNLPADAARLPYVNSLWQIQDSPYAGDLVNSYNDGEERPGAGQLGPFYELETSSPAAQLRPGESITHVHRTFHFAGAFDALNELAGNVLGVALDEIG